MLCFHGGVIVNIDIGIPYNGRSHEFLIATLDISLNELSKMLCDQLDWNMFEIEVKITWKMLQIRVIQAHYVNISICSDVCVNSMYGFASINMLGVDD